MNSRGTNVNNSLRRIKSAFTNMVARVIKLNKIRFRLLTMTKNITRRMVYTVPREIGGVTLVRNGRTGVANFEIIVKDPFLLICLRLRTVRDRRTIINRVIINSGRVIINVNRSNVTRLLVRLFNFLKTRDAIQRNNIAIGVHFMRITLYERRMLFRGVILLCFSPYDSLVQSHEVTTYSGSDEQRTFYVSFYD